MKLELFFHCSNKYIESFILSSIYMWYFALDQMKGDRFLLTKKYIKIKINKNVFEQEHDIHMLMRGCLSVSGVL